MAGRSSGRLVATLVVAAALASCACRDHREETQAVTSRTMEAVLAAHSDSLMALPGVVGTAIGRCDGAPCIRVFLAAPDDATRQRIPARLEGYPVRVEVTGPIRARDPRSARRSRGVLPPVPRA